MHPRMDHPVTLPSSHQGPTPCFIDSLQAPMVARKSKDVFRMRGLVNAGRKEMKVVLGNG